MPIKIAEGAKVLRSASIAQAIDTIRVVKSLAEAPVAALTGKVKKELLDADARYAESDDVVAHMRGGERTPAGTTLGAVPSRKLYELVKSKKITMEQFLDCVVVETTPLRDVLGADDIKKMQPKIRVPAGKTAVSLVTEFKPGVVFELKDHKLIGSAIEELVRQTVKR